MWGVRIGVVAAALTFAGAAPAHAGVRPALARDCDEQQAFIEGDSAAVAANLPARYTPVRAGDGNPLLFARAIRCRSLTAAGRSGRAVMASFGVVIETPDGLGCASATPGPAPGDVPPACNWYTLSWLANRHRVVHWLRRGTPAFPARYVPGLRFR